MVQPSLDNPNSLVVLALQVSQLALQSPHPSEHRVDRFEHLGLCRGVERSGRRGGGAEERIEVFLERRRRVQVVFVGLLRLLLQPSEVVERRLGGMTVSERVGREASEDKP